MCNNYANRKSAAEVARLFDVEPSRIGAFNAAEEIYPGYPGMVIRFENGARRLDAMTWGFPLRLKSMKPTSKPKPVNNTRDDKLHTPFWKASFEDRRCLIPLTAWAEAEGETGRMTKTWYSLPGVELFAVAGIWRPTIEWGDAYSMVMVNSCEQMADVHDRMPVTLHEDRYDQWLSGSPSEARALVRTGNETLLCDRTDEPWFSRRSSTWVHEQPNGHDG